MTVHAHTRIAGQENIATEFVKLDDIFFPEISRTASDGEGKVCVCVCLCAACAVTVGWTTKRVARVKEMEREKARNEGILGYTTYAKNMCFL